MNKRVLKPGKLKLGATIGLVSPAAPLAGLVRHRLDGCVTFLEKSGFKVRIGRHASSVTGYVSASAEDRAWDINEFFRSPEIDAIVCLIGGYHYNHVLPHLDLELIRSNPKIFIGYSDATVVQMALWSALHMVTFSGPAGLTQFAEYPAPLPYTLEYFQKATASNVPVGSVAASSEYTDEFLNWFGKEDQTRARKLKANRGYVTLREGQCSGRLLGGCLSSMLHLRGTKFWPDFNGALLCESTDIVSNRFLRKITAGAAVFTEQVILHPESKIETITLPHNNQLVAESSTLIEEPEPESLFVRFNYRRDLDTSTDSVNVAEYLKAAYVQLDREAIVLIRSLAQSEIDNATIN